MNAEPEPYLLEPRLWFGVLCEEFGTDQSGRLTFGRVFNQTRYFHPSETEGVPAHGFLNGILAIGFSGGVGEFTVQVTLHDADGRILWERPDLWEFTIGRGNAAAVLGEVRHHWLREPGEYYFQLEVRPPGRMHQVRFEVTEEPGPTQTELDDEERPGA